ncbi:zinc-ribbon domain-containing protein [Blastopirellula sp. J2-11]|uniref:zinc-ribbon domain-containing protein n=1 Tax=Blastopirellula sp. J2-11 TaxID=2943192 RepID=UPI0021C77776|nr:zinc-ribbon domain-containing protein [Blastopirellula sp. J2-11]UUO06812.1 zinc-ribbon domain-containing protein [Blastopirellula sp. J2-11]
MPIEFSCTSCSAKFRVADTLAGKKVRCPKCQGVEQVPMAAADPEPSTIAADELKLREEIPAPLALKTTPTYFPKTKRPEISYAEAKSQVAKPANVLLSLLGASAALEVIGALLGIAASYCFPAAEWGLIVASTSVTFAFVTGGAIFGVLNFKNLDDLDTAWRGIYSALIGSLIFLPIAVPFVIQAYMLMNDKKIAVHFHR